MKFSIALILSLLGLSQGLIVSSLPWSESIDELNLELLDANSNFSGIRHKRSSFEYGGHCNVSEDTNKLLLREIKTILANSSPRSNMDCEYDLHADNCSEILKLIQCGVNHLEKGVTEASTNADDYAKWKNAFDNLSEKFYRQIDDIKKSVSEDQQRTIDSLRSQIQNLSNRLNSAQSQLRVVRIRFITSEIGHGRLSSATEEFEALKDDSALPQIVKSTYNTYGGVNVFDNLINFLKKLPECSIILIAAFTALYDAMKQNNNANSPMMLVFSSDVVSNDCLTNSSQKDVVAGNVQNVLNTWVTNIRHQHYSEIFDFSKKYNEAFLRHFKELIEKTHDNNIQNIPNILDFIDNLDVNTKTNAYSVLYNSVKLASHGVNGPEFITLMYRVKETLDRSDLTTSQRDTLDRLKNDSPRGVKSLLWDRFVHIKSKKYPSNYLAFDFLGPGGRSSLTPARVIACPDSSGSGLLSKWKVNVVNRGRHFKFFNMDKDEFLHDELMEVTPVDNGDYYYFKINGRILDSNNKIGGWLGFMRSMPSDCSEPYLCDGCISRMTDRHKWRIE